MSLTQLILIRKTKILLQTQEDYNLKDYKKQILLFNGYHNFFFNQAHVHSITTGNPFY